MQLRLCIIVGIVTLFSQSGAKVIIISVSGEGFGPSSLTANTGDEIKISFTVGTASFTQSTFEEPCVALQGGFESNLVTIPSGAGPKSYSFTIFSQNPVYFFNKQPNQCQTGFVGTINASPQQNSAFRNNALNFDPNIVLAVPPATKPQSTRSNLPILTVASPALATTPDTIASQNAAVTSVTTREADNAPPPTRTLTTFTTNGRITTMIPLDAQGPTGAPLSSSQSSSVSVSTLASASRTAFPTQTSGSGPESTAGASTPSKGISSKKVVIAVLGAFLGLVVLLAGVLILVAARRRQLRFALSLFRRNSHPTIEGVQTSELDTLTQRVLGRFANMFTGPRLGWHRLGDGSENRISPFLADSSPVDPPPLAEKPIVFRHAEHRMSEDTLVARSDDMRRNTASNSSMLAVVSEWERDTEKAMSSVHRSQVDKD